MSRKVLNKKNLEALGAEVLADLLLEVVKGNAALQRRVRMELSANVGAEEVVRDIRKRFASLRRATAFVSWRGRRSFSKELSDIVDLIAVRVAPDAPRDAFDLLWDFLHLAPSIYERTDDSSGTFGDVMADAMTAIANLAPRLEVDPATLAETVFEALQDNGYGAFDGAIPALSVALGAEGLEHLKALATAAEAAPLSKADLDRYDFVSDDARRRVMALERRNLDSGIILKDIADLQGDVDAYMARYSAEQLTFHTIAPDVATRLLAAGRAQEALEIVDAARDRNASHGSLAGIPELDAAYIACLQALERHDEVSRFLWEDFCQTLNGERLRQYLKGLPDFDDIEAEERAKTIAMGHPSLLAALAFLINWPDLPAAAKLIETRHAELDGNAYYTLTPAADALASDHPLAATLAYRAMITHSLKNNRTKRYAYAARHLSDCAIMDSQIVDHQDAPDHARFIDGLRQAHGRKTSFWNLLETE